MKENMLLLRGLLEPIRTYDLLEPKLKIYDFRIKICLYW